MPMPPMLSRDLTASKPTAALSLSNNPSQTADAERGPQDRSRKINAFNAARLVTGPTSASSVEDAVRGEEADQEVEEAAEAGRHQVDTEATRGEAEAGRTKEDPRSSEKEGASSAERGDTSEGTARIQDEEDHR